MPQIDSLDEQFRSQETEGRVPRTKLNPDLEIITASCSIRFSIDDSIERSADGQRTAQDGFNLAWTRICGAET